ncbi:hypothetical protein IV203_003846 [Nitzschia inconspicua]|uniref:Uncharacterized protein n=1 Tax=Nitzschia inconspicua TaxID=303405 RepID=A0A9K3PNW4_9STRA|nr:hypothetical protein IV203_003846 [Nitzschia inconspicua]
MRKKYLEYRKDRDLIVTDPCTPVDYVLTDSSISTIIGAMWPGPDYTNFYNDIGEEEAQFFFSRRKNGRYSETAIKEFGYPNNVVAQSSSAHLPADYLSYVSKSDENHSTKHGLDRTLSPLRKRLRTVSQLSPFQSQEI